MKVLILSQGPDNGGIGAAIKRAFDKHSEIAVRAICTRTNWLAFEPDIVTRRIEPWLRWADVVHYMDKPGTKRPAVMHHHGQLFRKHRRTVPGITNLVATFDLLRYGGEWLPNPCDIDRMQRFRSAYCPKDRPLIAHSPTSRAANGTEAFLAAAEGLSTDLIERQPWAKCMERKAQADIVFDSFDIGYGLTSIEAFGMGIPVVSGADEWTEAQVIRHIGYLPYYPATPGGLRDALLEITGSPRLRAEYAARGWQCVNDFHAEAKVVERLTRVYQACVS